MHFKIDLKRTDEGFALWVPGLPGCWSQGADEAEAVDNIQAAISDYLAVVSEVPEDAELRETDVAG